MSKLFTDLGAWHGGWYELALELGPRDDDTLRQALSAMWSFIDLRGCYANREVEPELQSRIAPASDATRLYGVATMPSRARVPCATIVTREEDGSDWLSLALPLGSLSRAYPVGAFPFDDGKDLSWRADLDAWLGLIGRHVARYVRFEIGVVGSVDHTLDRAAVIDARGIPEKRWVGYLRFEGEELCWYAPNQKAPMS